MFKEENYEQIFSQKITNQSIDIIKKFFIFQPSTQTTSKPYTLISKLREPAAATINNRRTNNKFTGGFQQSVKLPNNN